MNSRALIAAAGLAAVFAAPLAKAQVDVHHDEERPHHASLLVAGTTIPSEDETAFTIGGDYEYRLNTLLGVGAVAEHAFGEIDATTLLAVADIHVWRGLAVQVGPGVEIIDGDIHAAGRIGALYELEIGEGVTLAPQLHYDISEENGVVFGVAFGRAF
ncbi:MAG: hypothetical protein AAFQ67_06290 [Pseudomonadota bacterium]